MTSKRQAKSKRKRTSTRSGQTQPAPSRDPRGVYGEGRVGPEWAWQSFNPDEPVRFVLVEPIRLEDGRELNFDAPHVVPLYLLKAKKLRDAAEPKRRATLTQTTTAPTGELSPQNAVRTFDAMEDLAVAVTLALAAIEAHANDVISRLSDDALVEIPARLGGRTVMVMRDKAAMDRMSLAEKITRAVPLLTGGSSIKGTSAWERFRLLRRLRNDLVHHRRDVFNDPDKPSPFGRLLLGEGSQAPEDAALVIEALEPGWLPSEIREALLP